MSEFKVGDRVKWVRDWLSLDLSVFTEYIGKEYTIDEIDVEYEYPYHLKEADLWAPEVDLEKVEEDIPLGKEEDCEVSAPAQDRCTITIERFGVDGKKYVSGCQDITADVFDELWDEYIEY